MGTEADAGQEQGTEGEEGATGAEGQQTRSLDELLSGLDEADRAVVLGEVRKGRTEAKNLRDRLKLAEPKASEYDRLAEASKNETQRAQDATAAAEARAAELASRAVKAEVKALAASDFADPEDAAAFLDVSSYVDDDGDVDSAQIQADLKELLTRKPHLARGDGKSRPRPDASQGSSSTKGAVPASPRDEFAQIFRGAAS